MSSYAAAYVVLCRHTRAAATGIAFGCLVTYADPYLRIRAAAASAGSQTGRSYCTPMPGLDKPGYLVLIAVIILISNFRISDLKEQEVMTNFLMIAAHGYLSQLRNNVYSLNALFGLVAEIICMILAATGLRANLCLPDCSASFLGRMCGILASTIVMNKLLLWIVCYSHGLLPEILHYPSVKFEHRGPSN